MESDWDIMKEFIVKGDENYKILDDGTVIAITKSDTLEGVKTFPIILGKWNSDKKKLKETYSWEQTRFPHTPVYEVNVGKRYESYFSEIF